VWARVVSRPEPDLALLTMGRRDVSFDADLPVPYGLADSRVTKLNDQHACLGLGGRPDPHVLLAEDVPRSVELRWRPGEHQAALT